MNTSPRVPLTPNNFDLLRLAAATQVMLAHADHYILHRNSFIAFFPGVPVFFFISGFLISASWERSPELESYGGNRALRIFPALWAVWAFTLAMLLAFFDRGLLLHHAGRLAAWSLMQVTIFQDWYPSFLEGFGTGLMNGSLWTIPVEIGFYLLTPIIYMGMRRSGRPATILITITALCWMLLIAVTALSLAGRAPRWADWVSLSPLPWLGMFTLGMLAQRHREWLLARLKNGFLAVVAIYGLLAILAAYVPLYPLLRSDGNAMGILNFAALCAVIMAAAYTNPWLADRLLRRNDISYGIYLVHMPVLNLVFFLKMSGATAYITTIAATVILAVISWITIERKALSFRAHKLLARPQ